MAGVVVVMLAVALLVACGEEKPRVQPLTKSWEKTVPYQPIPAGLWSLKSEDCGSCHVQHYEEWKLSTHSHAWTDQQFQAELQKESSPFLCINCHIPLQNQQEYIVRGLVDGDIYQPARHKNPNFDPELQMEGINCASCHVRNGAVIGPTGTEKAPHATVKDTDFLSESLCVGCHNATAVVTPTLACSFETGDEWQSGPYYGEKNCISCHMEERHREIVLGYGERLSHYHAFPGSGIPKTDTSVAQGLTGLDILPGWWNGSCRAGDTISFDLTVVNAHAGHRLPTGDPERFFLFTFTLLDDHQDTLGFMQERIGEEWQWHPEARKLHDNNLDPLEARMFVFSHAMPQSGTYSLHVHGEKHRLNQQSADYNNLGSTYPLFIDIYDTTLVVHVR